MNALAGILFTGAVILVVILACLGLLAFLLRQSKSKSDFKEPWPFYSVKLLTSPEQILYFRLVKALPEYVIFSQVQLSRLMKVKKGYPSYKWRNRIDRLSADFVVCTKDSSVVALIELDDATHEKEDRSKTDLKKDHALKSAGIDILRFKVLNMPDENTIRDLFKQKKPEKIELYEVNK